MRKVGPEGKKPAAGGDVVLVSQKPDAPPSPLVDPQEKKEPKPEDKKKNDLPPVTIAAFGNKIIISSDDPAALAMAYQLFRLVTQTTAGEGDFEVIHLHTANAVQAAQLLDQAFNGPKPVAQPQQGGPGGFGRFFQQFAAGQQSSADRRQSATRTRSASSPTPPPTRCWCGPSRWTC